MLGPQVQVWVAEYTFPPAPETHADKVSWRELSARITRQKGIGGLLRLPDFGRLQPARDLEVVPTDGEFSDGTRFADGTGFVEGWLPPYIAIDEAAARGAESIVVRGLPPSVPRCLRMGDLGEVRPNGVPAAHAHLYEVAGEAGTDANGKTRIKIQPPLRAGVAAGDQVVLQAPTSVFRLSQDDDGKVMRDVHGHGRLGFTAIEELPR